MKKIKFRAWDKNEKQMLYNVENTYDFGFRGDNNVMEDNFGDVLHDENYIVEQYTGLHDKNGVEIYEGDIVQDENGCKLNVEYGIQNIDAFEGVGFNLWDFYGNLNDIGKAIRLQGSIEVIGNVHEEEK